MGAPHRQWTCLLKWALREGSFKKEQLCGMYWRALGVRRQKFEGSLGSGEGGEHKGCEWGRTGSSSLSPHLTQIRMLQNTVLHVGGGAVQVPAFLAEKDLAACTSPTAWWPSPRLQHARLLRKDPLPVDGNTDAQYTAPAPAARAPAPVCSARAQGRAFTCPPGPSGRRAARRG